MTERHVRKPSADGSGRNPDQLGLNERLALIGLVEEGLRLGSSDSPVISDLFGQLWELVDRTVSGAKIGRFTSVKESGGFQAFEINAESGENLAGLHMLYMKKPLPCYYLVYVEVAPPFRNRGLGNMIVSAFKDFLDEKSALGLLDNIIPKDDPTYDIYAKQDWRPVAADMNPGANDADGMYMMYVPPSLRDRDLREPVRKLLHHLKRKRAAIDMRENEYMVRNTIEEFKDLYRALTEYFSGDLRGEETDPVVCFMFTRFVTKLLGFSHKIPQLIGYTGGESLRQLALDPEVAELPIKSYAPRGLASNPAFFAGDKELWLKLPEVLKKHPARMIESLSNYRRPKLVQWLKSRNLSSSDTLTIGDLMDIGFDPTRLKEITVDGKDYIFERVQARLLPKIEADMETLDRLAAANPGERIKHAELKINPPLLVIRDRGNGYVLRRKVEGIHWEEAVEQLQTDPDLRDMNQSVKVDRIVRSTVNRARDYLARIDDPGVADLADRTAYFVSWDLEANRPQITVDFAGSFLRTIWIA